MQFLGEFLSPSNSIGQDVDKLTKYFYFQPDKYDKPNSEVQNIFKVREMSQFPKINDILAENEKYIVQNIEVSKKLSDDQDGVTRVSYVVTATYDTKINIDKRNQSGSSGGSSSSDSGTEIDQDGNKVSSTTPPWKLRANVSWQPVAVNKAFTKAIGSDGKRSKDVVNAAGSRIIAETQRYQMEISWSKNFEKAQKDTFDLMFQPYVNEKPICWTNIMNNRLFKTKTLLILPPSCSINYWQTTDEERTNNI